VAIRWFYAWGLCAVLAGVVRGQESAHPGKAIYSKHCASCHGKEGEGVKDKCDDPLQGERSLSSLTRYIDRNMPEGEEHLVVGEDARNVAEYIMGAFYSAEARANKPSPKMAFARLTNRQFRESVADLLGSFTPWIPPGEGTGLQSDYFQSDGMNKKARKVHSREDAALSFDFAAAAPVEGIQPDQFSIAWDGSLLAPVTGWYEFRISTPNGARLYLNGIAQDGDGNHRDDSGGKRQPAFIDSWVSSGDEVRHVSARIFLLGGRAYPLRMDYFKYKEKRGMVRVDWKRPQGEWQVLAAPYLSPARAAHVAVISTAFPADDASEGYERGTGVSKEWHEATTAAAIEAANQVVAKMYLLSGIKNDDPERVNKFREFLQCFAERAFRHPLDQEMRRIYIDSAFAEGVPLEQSVKRAVILILKSPRFLYPQIRAEKDDHTIATRLALGLWDSLPDAALLAAAKEGQLRRPDVLRSHAQRMLQDLRARQKLLVFFRHWLKLDAEADMRKNGQLFPGFDAVMVADLQRSLELFVEQVVWSETSDYRQLMLADTLWLNQRLATYYRIPDVVGDAFKAVPAGQNQRSGIITHPYLLARLAHPDTTSPIHRGVFLTRNVLGGILKPPPEAIAFENHKFDPKMTMREKISEMTRSSNCMTCHETINPLGFTLENFDATGRYRDNENNRPILTESDFNTLEGELLRLKGPQDVAQLAVRSASARRGFIRQLLQSAIKQNPAVYGSDFLHKLDEHFVAQQYHIRNLFLEINLRTALHSINLTPP
jgi:cytochrome c553